MNCDTGNYLVRPLVKHPSGQHAVELNFYRDCINVRRSNNPYLAGAFFRPERGNGYAYECTVEGTTGEREPVFPTTINATVRDGSAEFTCRAAGLNAVNSISAPSADITPSGSLTVSAPIVEDGWKIIAVYSGGTLGQDYTAAFTFTLGGRTAVVSQLVEVRRT